MARELLPVDVSHPKTLVQPLSNALDSTGPAVFPFVGTPPIGLPTEVSDDVVVVVETSGSTAHPKRVWHTAASLNAAAQQTNSALGEPGVWWSVLPGHYIAGLMVSVRALHSGGRVVFRNPQKTLREALHQFAQEALSQDGAHPRYTSVVPKQLADLVAVAETDPDTRRALQSFDGVLVGGQRTPDALIDRATHLGVTVTKTYGLAETAGGCVWNGTPLAQTVVDVFDGRVAVAGPMLAGGYLGDSERTDKAFVEMDSRRWFLSDDRGQFSGGRLTVTGRVDRVAISGGVKVSLDEVEATLQREYPEAELAVVSVTDQTWGEALAVITTTPVGREAVQATVTKSHGLAARVGTVRVVDRLPRLDSGKVDRLGLEALLGSQRQ